MIHYGAAGKLGQQFIFPMFGAPKTMDNDVYGTEMTYGFESSVEERSTLSRTPDHRRIA